MVSLAYNLSRIKKCKSELYRLIFKSRTHSRTLQCANEPSGKLEDKYSSYTVENPDLRPWDSDERFQYVLNHDVNARTIQKYNENGFPKTFSLALPPPNVTGSLHLGHALTATLQDVLCRFLRLNGTKVCWLPGTDHAGIATQVVVEKYLAKQNITRHQLGYEKFNEEVLKWKETNKGKIQEQIRSLGASLDWSKEVYTMDATQTRAVKEAFVRLFDAGLIYRSKTIVNWSCCLNSSISDIEVNNMDVAGPTALNIPGYSKPIKLGFIYEIAYKSINNSKEIVVATTRPETLLGDVAIAVNPDDNRYSHLVGTSFRHPFLDRNIPLILDEAVDKNFGTGALKITPAHDRDDYAIAKKHGLDMPSVINGNGNIEDGCSMFSGMKRYDARDLMLNELAKLDLLRSVKDHSMIVPMCSRSGDIVEQLLCPQWYMNCEDLYEDTLEYVRSGALELIPKNYESVWSNWLQENRDWCISRQLWWGHRIPAYKCHTLENSDKTVWVAALSEEDAKSRASKIFNEPTSNIICEQDNDVLDTWFSAGIYPFSAHGWPEDNSAQYKQLYPLDLMVTGHDITFFWVCRMVMLGAKLTGRLPFSKVLLHGIVCDAKGSKMSKSKGNVIEPEDIVNGISLIDLNNKARLSHAKGLLSDKELENTLEEQRSQYPEGIPQCGTDALRFTLCSENVKSSFINFDVQDCFTNKLFCNKIWQSLKFAQNVADKLNPEVITDCNRESLGFVDLWLLSRLSSLVDSVYGSLGDFNFHVATMSLRRFLYQDLCDFYIECAKMDMRPVLHQEKCAAHCHTLSVSFHTALRLLAPFMPFLSEKLIGHIPVGKNCLITYDDTVDNLLIRNKDVLLSWKDENLEREFDTVMQIITAVRQVKSAHKISKNNRPNVYISSQEHDSKEVALKYNDLILYLTSSEKLSLIDNNETVDSNMWKYTSDNMMKVYVKSRNPQNNEVHGNPADDKMLKKIENMKKTLEKLEKTVSAEGFKKAPPHAQKSLRAKILTLKDELSQC